MCSCDYTGHRQGPFSEKKVHVNQNKMYYGIGYRIEMSDQ